ncbi:MBL fold metallo-hydrolase [Clostridium formicaceticum]|uniref:MBL fold metallo-hydrolase n=1 Tax=Clostridium formicaceticum TaxID=1497 RepID=A0AAC9WHE9_9CLOT|nr:MBL fold metallo-hydrolase [Clostridium formicaceticum]AOY78082.1 MBL fold metallo-hydrolase [Clostridium formicaceticum]ARE88724.1 putative metallo-hydrolase YflN [Clostridium formicaceticum]
MQENILQQITQKPMGYQQVTPDIMLLEFPFVNVCIIGDPKTNNGEWVLIGAGMAHTSKDIIQAAEARFGKGSQPKAIILTHGHFDHVGAIMELLNQWNVPVYAHELELPYLTGAMDYPPADPTVNDGLITKISPTFPNKSINLGNRVRPLPADGNVPSMPGWRWIHTPGHSPGHVALYRESDRTLIAGDAFTTLKQDYAESVLAKEKEVNGPPAYFTMDWQAAEKSVRTLKDLHPQIAVSSHGRPMEGKELNEQLTNLANNFASLAVPNYGKYIQ